VTRVSPVYPDLARRAGIEGAVRLAVVIAKDGRIAHIQVNTGHPLLIPAALEAVRQWQYQPTLLNGQPVEVRTDLELNFVLGN
jgi:protein TonB